MRTLFLLLLLAATYVEVLTLAKQTTQDVNVCVQYSTNGINYDDVYCFTFRGQSTNVIVGLGEDNKIGLFRLRWIH